MPDFNAFLATLSQSLAAIVAIIGGFLVSRLVAMSSEREGTRRQRNASAVRLTEYKANHIQAYSYRFERSVKQLGDWIMNDIVELVVNGATPDFHELLIAKNNIPRGSSYEEMLPKAQALILRVTAAKTQIEKYLKPTDTTKLDFANLRERGLTFSEADANIYEEVFGVLRNQLTSPPQSMFDPPSDFLRNLAPLTPGWAQEVDARRLDESIAAEQQANGLVTATENEIARLESDLDRLAQPIGVTSAVIILAIYSVLGIVLPLTIMGLGIDNPPVWLVWVLLGAFIVGLGSVLI